MTPHGHWSPEGWHDFKRHFVPLAIGATVLVIFAVMWVTLAHGGTLTVCVPQPLLELADISQWQYRTKVDGRLEKCWYVGKRMKPRSELRWEISHPIPSIEPAGTTSEHNEATPGGTFLDRWKAIEK